ncbi:Translation initiation factor 2 [Actinosynnema pretiosum subsp. pretiosum]|nr:Translation initiation factor 2 [Actinosynnema pretiosum subsp. pretiosum]
MEREDREHPAEAVSGPVGCRVRRPDRDRAGTRRWEALGANARLPGLAAAGSATGPGATAESGDRRGRRGRWGRASGGPSGRRGNPLRRAGVPEPEGPKAGRGGDRRCFPQLDSRCSGAPEANGLPGLVAVRGGAVSGGGGGAVVAGRGGKAAVQGWGRGRWDGGPSAARDGGGVLRGCSRPLPLATRAEVCPGRQPPASPLPAARCQSPAARQPGASRPLPAARCPPARCQPPAASRPLPASPVPAARCQPPAARQPGASRPLPAARCPPARCQLPAASRQPPASRQPLAARQPGASRPVPAARRPVRGAVRGSRGAGRELGCGSTGAWRGCRCPPNVARGDRPPRDRPPSGPRTPRELRGGVPSRGVGALGAVRPLSASCAPGWDFPRSGAPRLRGHPRQPRPRRSRASRPATRARPTAPPRPLPGSGPVFRPAPTGLRAGRRPSEGARSPRPRRPVRGRRRFPAIPAAPR